MKFETLLPFSAYQRDRTCCAVCYSYTVCSYGINMACTVRYYFTVHYKWQNEKILSICVPLGHSISTFYFIFHPKFSKSEIASENRSQILIGKTQLWMNSAKIVIKLLVTWLTADECREKAGTFYSSNQQNPPYSNAVTCSRWSEIHRWPLKSGSCLAFSYWFRMQAEILCRRSRMKWSDAARN